MMLHFKKPVMKLAKKEDGYTLLELLVVLVILTLIVGVAGPQIISQFESAKSRTAEVEVNRLVTELEFFRVDVGRFPTSEEGLDALLDGSSIDGWAGPYLAKEEMTVDPWGNDYEYSVSGDTVTVTSLGPDGTSGTDDISGGN